MVADESSRELSKDTKWSLDCRFFIKFVLYLTNHILIVFASRLYNILPKYGFSHWILQHVQLMLSIWTWIVFFLYYSFPSISCIGRLLQKTLINRAEIILVAPLWNTHHWFTKILKLLVADTIILPLTQQIVSFPVEPETETLWMQTIR